MISEAIFSYFSEELAEKVAAIPAPTPPQAGPPKKKKGMGISPLTVGAGVIGLGAVLKNPATAQKYLGRLKGLVTSPKDSFVRGMRTGASNIKQGPGASASAAKKQELFKEVLEGAQQGRKVSIEALENPQGLRASGWGSVGTSRSAKDSLKLDDKLQGRVDTALKRIKDGDDVDMSSLSKLYGDIQTAGQGLKTRKGLTYYLPGERALFPGLGVAGGAAGALPSEDADGRKRSVGERLVRGAAGAYLGAATAPLWYSRGMGLQKGLQAGAVPIAGGTLLMEGEGLAQKGIDKAFK